MTARQLPLLIPNEPLLDEARFLSADSNAAARTWLDRTDMWPDRRLALWGDADHGKTHLARIWATRHGAAWFDGPDLSGLPAVTGHSHVAVDDAVRADPHALLHLLNTARDLGRTVLLTGRTAPGRWPVTVPDLVSRLRAITAVEISAPDDDMLRALLLRWLTDQRLFADESLHDWIMTRLPRSPAVLRAAVLRLDHDALISRKRLVTPAMLRTALADDPALFSRGEPSG